MMPGPWQLLIILLVVLLLVGGGGKITKIMRDMGSGITAFKKGLKGDDAAEASEREAEPRALDDEGAPSASQTGDSERRENGPRTPSS